MTKKTIIVLVGPSGSGKTSIGKILSQQGIPRLTTTTTREPREGELEGIDYYFRDYSAMKIENFIEQTVYNGNRYGLTKEEVESMLQKYDIVHVALDQNGAEAVKKAFPEEAFIVFVQINEEKMMERMKKRGDTEEEIKARIAFSRKTQELVPPADANLIVENIDIHIAAQKIIENVIKHHSN